MEILYFFFFSRGLNELIVKPGPGVNFITAPNGGGM